MRSSSSALLLLFCLLSALTPSTSALKPQLAFAPSAPQLLSSSIAKTLSPGSAAAPHPVTLRPSVLSTSIPQPVVLRASSSRLQAIRPLRATGTSTVLDKPDVATAPQNTPEQSPDKPYHVLLFNDPINTREYVCEILCSVFGHSKSQAYDIMQTAHTTGFAVCNTTDKEEADSQSAELGEKNLMSSVVQAD